LFLDETGFIFKALHRVLQKGNGIAMSFLLF